MGELYAIEEESIMRCWMCGKENATVTRELKHRLPQKRFAPPVWELNRLESQRCYCQECFDKHMAQLEKENNLYIRLKRRRMLETAIDIMEHQDLELYEYREAIKTVRDFIERCPDKFDSSYEVLAVIILLKHRIRCKMQYKIGRYQVDILLPDLFVALEIDGERHQYKKNEDRARDLKIKMVLGSDWELIRIKTDYLDEHAEHLLDAIKEVCDHRAFTEY